MYTNYNLRLWSICITVTIPASRASWNTYDIGFDIQYISIDRNRDTIKLQQDNVMTKWCRVSGSELRLLFCTCMHSFMKHLNLDFDIQCIRICSHRVTSYRKSYNIKVSGSEGFFKCFSYLSFSYVTGFAKRDLFDKLQKLSLAAIQVPLGLPFIVT